MGNQPLKQLDHRLVVLIIIILNRVNWFNVPLYYDYFSLSHKNSKEKHKIKV